YGDWSSDVCSSDLNRQKAEQTGHGRASLTIEIIQHVRPAVARDSGKAIGGGSIGGVRSAALCGNRATKCLRRSYRRTSAHPARPKFWPRWERDSLCSSA